ncbi:MAG: efflux RND transporter periplasmic adaptor subunit [Planctomycetota bacterium]
MKSLHGTMLACALAVPCLTQVCLAADAPAKHFPSIDTATVSYMIPGTAQARREVIKGAPHDGVLQEIVVEQGQWVSTGDVIARMDDATARAAVALAREQASRTAGVERAQHSLKLAELQLTRTMSANEGGAVNETEVEDARLEVEIARASLNAALEDQRIAGLELMQAEARLEEHVIRAPFDGRVITIDIEPGAVLQIGDPIATICDYGTLKVDVMLPASWYHQLKKDADYQFHADAPVSREIEGRLVYIEPRVDAAVGGIRCRFFIENPKHALPVGFIVRPITGPETALSAHDGRSMPSDG